MIEQKVKEARQFIAKKTTLVPQFGITLGSGLSPISDLVENSVKIPYAEIPHFHAPTVQGHSGTLVLGTLQGIPVVILKGRYHFYEGHSMETVVFPTRVIHALGIHSLILTNAAGGVNTRFRPGDLMLIEDHLNLMGADPLRGPALSFGPRFLDLTHAYDRTYLEIFRQAAQALEIPIHKGVYAGLTGPCYETPAEVRMLRTLGADAVGMSTVPETIAARHLGLKVLGMSCIANLAAGLTGHPLSHEEVLEVSKIGSEKIQRLLLSALSKCTKE